MGGVPIPQMPAVKAWNHAPVTLEQVRTPGNNRESACRIINTIEELCNVLRHLLAPCKYKRLLPESFEQRACSGKRACCVCYDSRSEPGQPGQCKRGNARREQTESLSKQDDHTCCSKDMSTLHFTKLSSNDAPHIRIVQLHRGPGNMHSTARWGKCSKLDHTLKSLFERTDFSRIQEILQMLQQFPFLIELCLEPGECLQDI